MPYATPQHEESGSVTHPSSAGQQPDPGAVLGGRRGAAPHIVVGRRLLLVPQLLLVEAEGITGLAAHQWADQMFV